MLQLITETSIKVTLAGIDICNIRIGDTFVNPETKSSEMITGINVFSGELITSDGDEIIKWSVKRFLEDIKNLDCTICNISYDTHYALQDSNGKSVYADPDNIICITSNVYKLQLRKAMIGKVEFYPCGVDIALKVFDDFDTDHFYTIHVLGATDDEDINRMNGVSTYILYTDIAL